MNTSTDPAALRKRAEELRQQAAARVRFIRQSSHGPGPGFARARADELYREADQLSELAERLEGGTP